QRHIFLASIAPETRSYNFRYHGKFTDVAGTWDLELEADLKSPNYVNNFFGMGNESVFNDEIDDEPGIGVDEAIQYYRYRFRELAFYPTLSSDVAGFVNLRFGPMFQWVRMERPDANDDRFIEAYANTLDYDLFDNYDAFAGGAWLVTARKVDST